MGFIFTVPADFSSVLQEYTSEGYRVIAIAHKTLHRLPYAKVQRLSREAAEMDLTFLSFVVMENRLKPQTSPVIEALNAAHIRTVMVTGDNILTALSVARDCDLVQPATTVIIVSTVIIQNHLKPQLYFTRSETCQSSPTSPIEQKYVSEMTELHSVVSLETIESGSLTNNRLDNNHYLCDK